VLPGNDFLKSNLSAATRTNLASHKMNSTSEPSTNIVGGTDQELHDDETASNSDVSSPVLQKLSLSQEFDFEYLHPIDWDSSNGATIGSSSASDRSSPPPSPEAVRCYQRTVINLIHINDDTSNGINCSNLNQSERRQNGPCR
jgi:hypothetical protein